MNPTAADLMAERRRLEILQFLKEDPDYRINDAMLCELLKLRGNGASLAVVRGDLAWLEQQRLITTQDLPGCIVALLRNDGVDVANGVATVPGIARPRPE